MVLSESFFEKRSTTTIRTEYPLDSERPHKKSISIDFQGFFWEYLKFREEHIFFFFMFIHFASCTRLTRD